MPISRALLLATLLLVGCMPTLRATGSLTPGDWQGFFTDPGASRKGRYVLHIPEGVQDTPALVVLLHGVSNTAATMAAKTRMNQLARKHGFVALYPEGMGVMGRWQHWNAGFCCGLAHERGVDDVAFVRRCIQDVLHKTGADPRRVYLVGHSNGGMLAYAFAARYPQELRAIGVAAGTAGGNARPGEPLRVVQPHSEAVALVVVHGEEDHVMPLHGGASKDPFLAQYGERLGLQDSVEVWLQHNRCNEAPQESERFRGRVLQRDWCAGEPRRSVRLLLVRNWPHAWPGLGAGPVPGYRLPHGFDAGEAMWEFFEGLEE